MSDKLRSILIIAPFVSLPGEPYYNRFLYLADMWARDYRVTLVTSSFCHFQKRHRDRESSALKDLPFDLVLLDEPGYSSNISFSRIKSHRKFVSELALWLIGQRGKIYYDIAYSAYPLVASNFLLSEFRGEFGYKLVIDVQDVWPESISAVSKFLGRNIWLLWIFSKRADRAYTSADALVAVSRTYLDRARKKCPTKNGLVVYLGSDIALIDSIPPVALASGSFRLIYIGTVSYSYDLETLVLGFVAMRSRFPNIELHIFVDGPLMYKIRRLADDKVFFHGFVLYENMVAFAKSCDLAINPIVISAAQSVTNKISDYFALGLPILSSQLCPEVRQLVEASGGEHYEAGDVKSFCNGLEIFLRSSQMKQIQHQTRELGARLFDRRSTYPEITIFLQDLIRDGKSA